MWSWRWIWAALALALSVATPVWAGPSAGVPEPGVVLVPPSEPPDVPLGWVRVETEGLQIAGPVEDEALLRRLAEHAKGSVPSLARELGVPVGGRIHAVLAPSDELFRAMQPGAPPSWADATAWPGQGWIFLRHPKARGGLARPLEQVLDHELVHILLGRAFAPAPVPSWLQEGAAQVLSGEAGPELPARLRRGIATTGGTLRLEDLMRGFPADPHRADLAYALSADLVHFLRRTWGPDALREVVRAGAAGRGIERALYDATGESVASLDRRWQQTLPSVGGSYLSPEVMEASLWVFAALIVVTAGGWRLRERARRTREARQDAGRIRELAREVLQSRRETVDG